MKLIQKLSRVTAHTGRAISEESHKYASCLARRTPERRRNHLTLRIGFAMITCIATLGLSQPSWKRWDFEDAKVGELPKGWTQAKTGSGVGSVWKVLEDSSAPKGSKVLAQTSPDGPNPLFNLCIAEETEYLDVQINAAIKPRDGELDQGGGLVWRYQDSNNYYVARFNPLEENYRVYKVVEGKRSQLGTAASDAATGKWHTMQIIHKGNHIQCYLNDKPYLDVTDDTFKEAGKIGLWTKADAQTSFDGLEVRGK